MNETPTSDTPLWDALPDLTLTIAQTAALCSISVRQLGYWTQQGYVSASGSGARRTYGLESVKQVLAIRRAMNAGASLRQALRQVSAGSVAAPPPPTAAADPHALSRSLAAFFEMNSCTRDHAGGLAVKLGWGEEETRAAADSLCESGILIRVVCAGLPIFHSAAWEDSHA